MGARVCSFAPRLLGSWTSDAADLRERGARSEYRPHNDIEVDGRKISGTGGFFDGDTLFYQGTLLIDFDPQEMIAALKVPVEKLTKRDLASARQRVVTMREILGDKLPDLKSIYHGLLEGLAERLGILPQWGRISDLEGRLAEQLFRDEIGFGTFVEMLDPPEVDNTVMSASLTRPGGRAGRPPPGRAEPPAHSRGADHRRFLRHAAARRCQHLVDVTAAETLFEVNCAHIHDVLYRELIIAII
jgi:hypothetical protein